MNFQKWVKSVQTEGYKDVRTIDVNRYRNLNVSVQFEQKFGTNQDESKIK